MKKISSISFFLILTLSVFSQQNISGNISDLQNIPLSFANVLLLNSSDSSLVKGTITDEKGNFLFKNIQKGSYLINVSMMSYQPFWTEIFTINDTDLNFPIQLNENTETLNELTISAKRPLFEQQIDRTVVNVQNSIASKGTNALDILSRSPGMDVDRMNSRLSMLGKQGVIVMLNGKRMRLEDEGLIQFLQGLPADNIQKIELITTPPASFDAEGNAGIINIITIKKEDEGINGNLSLNTGYGAYAKFGNAFNINIRKKNVHVFADFSSNYDISQQNISLSRTNFFEDQVIQTDVEGNRPAIVEMYNGRMGMDYYIGERSILGVLFSGYRSKWTLDGHTVSTIQDNLNGNFRQELAAFEINNWWHGMANVNFRHTFLNGDQLSFDVDYLTYFDNNPTDYSEQTFDEDNQLISESEFISRKITPIAFQVVKLDYNKKISDAIQLQTGIKGTHSEFINDVGVENLDNGTWNIDSRFTDIFLLEESIGAAYLSLDYRISNKWNSKAGLRYEYYDSEMTSESEGGLLHQKFGRLYPTLFLSYDVNAEQQLQISYNERITRPAMNNLAPAFFFFDNNTILAGNPSVRPTISRSISTSYKHKTALLTLQYTDQDNPFSYQPTVLAEENILINRAENMADMKTAMASLNVPFSFTNWWESRYNLAGYYLKTVPVFEGETFPQTTYYATFNTTQNFKLPNDFGLELSANWRSALKWGLGQVPHNLSINTGIQKKINDQMQLTLSWNDMFNLGSFFGINYDRPDLNMVYDFHYEQEGDVFRLNFSWNFGNNKIKKNNRATSSDEERQRVN